MIPGPDLLKTLQRWDLHVIRCPAEGGICVWVDGRIQGMFPNQPPGAAQPAAADAFRDWRVLGTFWFLSCELLSIFTPHFLAKQKKFVVLVMAHSSE